MERKFKITVEGREYNVTVEEQTDLDSNSQFEAPISFQRSAPPASTYVPAVATNTHATPQVPAEPGDVVSTMGGVVESLLVTIGQEIKAGDRVIVIEAMKMKTPITANQGGKVADILVEVGEGVQTGQVLVKLA
jgi:biotin carboxyl carrier protein